MAKKRVKRKVGSSYITMRKIGGKRCKAKVTKVSKTKYTVRKVGAKKRRKSKK